MDRRDLLTGGFKGNDLNLGSSSDSLYAYAKLLGSSDSGMVHYCLEGTIFAYLPSGAIPLIGFRSILKHVWKSLDKKTCKYDSYESGFFHGLNSAEPIKEFNNPVTNEINILSEIRGGPYHKEISSDQINWERSGDDVWIQEPNTRKGHFGISRDDEKLEYAFANSIFRGKLSDLNDSSTTSPSVMTYNFVSPWYPFFQMDNIEGKMYWQAVGTKIQSWSNVPHSIQKFLDQKNDNFFGSAKPWKKRTSTLQFYRDSLEK